MEPIPLLLWGLEGMQLFGLRSANERILLSIRSSGVPLGSCINCSASVDSGSALLVFTADILDNVPIIISFQIKIHFPHIQQ